MRIGAGNDEIANKHYESSIRDKWTRQFQVNTIDTHREKDEKLCGKWAYREKRDE